MPIKDRYKFFQSVFVHDIATEGVALFVDQTDGLEVAQRQEKFDRQISAFKQVAFSMFAKKLDYGHALVFSQNELEAVGLLNSQPFFESLELTYLAKAIVDDDRASVRRMLDVKPELLLCQPSVIVDSEYTRQRFSVDGNFLGLACRRKQWAMVEMILPYFEQLKAKKNAVEQAQIDAVQNAGLSQWIKYQVDENHDIIVPEAYQALINRLIETFKTQNIQTLETEMNLLYECLLPGVTNQEQTDSPVFTLDVELLLYAAYKAFHAGFNMEETSWRKRSAYCERVISIIQNFLPPETAKAFCAGLHNFVVHGLMKSIVSDPLKLGDGTDFYLAPGLDVQKWAGIRWVGTAAPYAYKGCVAHDDWKLFGRYLLEKQEAFIFYLRDKQVREALAEQPAAPRISLRVV